MSNDIPDDVMIIAHNTSYEIAKKRRVAQVEIIARAIMAERKSATKAEQGRCAGIARDFVKSSREKFDTCISDSAKGKRNLEYAAACAVGLCSASGHIAQLIESDERDGGVHGVHR